MDTRLVGYWSDKDLYPGAMEAADIAFGADGTGWIYWYNAARGFEVSRFTWQQTSSAAIVLHLREYVWGTWSLDGGAVTHEPGKQSARDEQIALGYEIIAGQHAAGDPATVLQFDQQVINGAIGNRFAFERELAAGEHDPAYGLEIPPGVT